MISPDAALLIIKGWLETGSKLYVSASSINLSVWSNCRVEAIEESKAVFRSIDRSTIIAFVVEDGFSFEYKQLREVAGKPGFELVPADRMLNSALTATLKSPISKGDLVQLIFIEM